MSFATLEIARSSLFATRQAIAAVANLAAATGA